MTKPLDGVRVLDVGTLTPGKYCSYLLADLGADVVRIERPITTPRPLDDEDLILNQGKRSVALNLRSEIGRRLFLRLAGAADIVLEGNRPGTADRLGIGYEAVKQTNTRIIYCALSGYGATGPLSQAPGYDLIFLGLSGLLRTLVGKGSPPEVPQLYLADSVAGLSAAYAIVVALFARERTGQGRYVDLAMLDSVFSLLAVSHGVRRGASVAAEAVTIPTYDVYPAADETYLVLGAIRPSSNQALFAHLGRPELADSDPGNDARAFLHEAFRTKSADAWVAELAPLDVEIGCVNSPDAAFDHPQLRQRQMVGRGRDETGDDFDFIRPSLNPDLSQPRADMAPAPLIGEHTEAVLKTVGVTDDELAAVQSSAGEGT